MEPIELSLLPRLLLMVACATSMALVWGWGTAGKGIERRRYLVLGEVVVWGCVPLLRRESMLRIEHHLLVGPLRQLGIRGVKVGRLLGYLWWIWLRWLLLRVILIKGRVKGRGSNGRRPAALRLLNRVRKGGRVLGRQLLRVLMLSLLVVVGRRRALPAVNVIRSWSIHCVVS